MMQLVFNFVGLHMDVERKLEMFKEVLYFPMGLLNYLLFGQKLSLLLRFVTNNE